MRRPVVRDRPPAAAVEWMKIVSVTIPTFSVVVKYLNLKKIHELKKKSKIHEHK